MAIICFFFFFDKIASASFVAFRDDEANIFKEFL